MELPNEPKAFVKRHNKSVYDCGDFVAKEFAEDKPASDVFNEALNDARANEAGLPAPAVLEVSCPDGRWTIFTERFPGRSLRTQLKEGADPKEVLTKLVKLQLKVQSASAPLLNRQKDKLARMIDSVKELDPSTRYELQVRLDGLRNAENVCHGDVNPSNVIEDEEGNLYLVDWAHATRGNAACDVAMTYMLLTMRDGKEVADLYLDLYSKAADMPKQEVMNCLPIVAAAELARDREDDKDFLMSWIDVADYQ